MKPILAISIGLLFLAITACGQAPEPAISISPTVELTATSSPTPKPTFTPTPEPTLTPTAFTPVVSEDRSGCVVTVPPEEFRHQFWYHKYCDAGGIAILSSKNVSDKALQQAYYIITNMFAPIPDRKDDLVQEGFALVIYNTMLDNASDIPALPAGATLPDYAFAFWRIPVAVTSEEDLLCQIRPGGRVTIHELAHSLEFYSLLGSKDYVIGRNHAFAHAKQEGLWKRTYAMTSIAEFWAESVTAFFGVYGDPYGMSGNKNREEFALYDPTAFAMVDEAFHAFNWSPTCP